MTSITRRHATLAGLALALTMGTGAVSAQTKWDMPTPYPDGNFHTVAQGSYRSFGILGTPIRSLTPTSPLNARNLIWAVVASP